MMVFNAYAGRGFSFRTRDFKAFFAVESLREKKLMANPVPQRAPLGGCQPILRVENMKTSLQFYVDVLGFENASWGTEFFTSIRRDRTALYLCQGGQGGGAAWVWIGVENVEKNYEEFKALGVKIRMAPKNFEWAMEMQIEDPDGNVFRLGSDPKSDRPFSVPQF